MYTLLSVPKSEMLDAEYNAKRLAKAFSDMGCNADEAIRAFNDASTVIVTARDRVDIELYDKPTENSNHKVIRPKSTNCPNCGAPIDIHAEKCAYCDTPYI